MLAVLFFTAERESPSVGGFSYGLPNFDELLTPGRVRSLGGDKGVASDRR